MKVCEICGEDIDGTKDGENRCEKCLEKRKRLNRNRRARDQAMRDLGLVKVKGAMGGTYWE